MPNKIKIRKVMLHQYEEPILVSPTDTGSGTIFFAGCNLKCVYCQNYDVSHSSEGLELSPEQLANIFKDLELSGAGNIDLVTPTHFTDLILQALKIYKPQIPVIWNSSGYESVETIKKLDGYIDIYLTDFKYADNKYALKYSKVNNYFENAKNSLIEMKNQIKTNSLKNGKLVKGIIVRHLVLPHLTKDSLQVLDTIYDILGKDAIVSIMSQYTPIKELSQHYPEINRHISKLEYKTVVSHALKLGLKNAFIQDYESANIKYTPVFDDKIIEIKKHQ